MFTWWAHLTSFFLFLFLHPRRKRSKTRSPVKREKSPIRSAFPLRGTVDAVLTTIYVHISRTPHFPSNKRLSFPEDNPSTTSRQRRETRAPSSACSWLHASGPVTWRTSSLPWGRYVVFYIISGRLCFTANQSLLYTQLYTWNVLCWQIVFALPFF